MPMLVKVWLATMQFAALEFGTTGHSTSTQVPISSAALDMVDMANK